MEIRRAMEKDIPGMLSLLRQVGLVHHNIRPDIFPETTLKYDESALLELLKDEDRPIFVAMDGDFVAGYCFCVLKKYEAGRCSHQHQELYIDDLCVDENRRGQGIAKGLYQWVCGWAKDAGCDFLTLNVWCGNDGAMKFYDAMGMNPRSIIMETKL